MNLVVIVGVVVTVATVIPVLLQLKGQPRGLFVLFFAEMWERFSYYGMRALLIYYLTQHFLFGDKVAAGQYGAYTTMVYLLPLIGGVLADRWLGTRKAIAFGAILLVIGQLGLAIEGRPAEQVLHYGGATYAFQTEGRADARHVRLRVGGGAYDFGPAATGGLEIKGLPATAPLPPVLKPGSYDLAVTDRQPLFLGLFYLALSLIIVGVGYLKANISSIVGQLYAQGDPKRDAGFTLYYYGVNLGAFWATIACGALGQSVGWWAGFGLAGIGMALGLIVFVLGRSWLDGRGEPPDPVRLKRRIAGPVTAEGAIYLAAVPALAVVWLLLQRNAVVGWLLGAGSVAILGYLAWYMRTKAGKVARERLGLALVLMVGSVMFWTLFEQAGSSLSLFAERNSQLNFGSVHINAAQTQSFNPGFILIFAPAFAALWSRLGRMGRDPSPMYKFGLALLQVGLGFLVLVVGTRFAGPDFREPLMFLALSYLLQTTGELCLSPVGLSEVTKLSPLALISTMVAVWFLSISWAEWVAAIIAGLTGSETVGGQALNPALALSTSTHVFGIIGASAIALGVVFFALAPFLKKWAHGVNDPHAHAGAAPEPIAPTPDGERSAVSPAIARAEKG